MENNSLNIVNEDGEIIGCESRDLIHRKGLLHQEVHVLFYTPNGEMIFQHRAKEKETYPDLLDAAVGGHIEIGEAPIDAAIKETEEETGVLLKPQDLQYIKRIKHKSFDKLTDRTNNAIKYEYAYCYKGAIDDLRVEEGKALGFEAWPINKILEPSNIDRKKFIPFLFNDKMLEVIKLIKELNG